MLCHPGCTQNGEGGDVNDGFSMMDFGDEKWSVRKKRLLTMVCLFETIFFKHSEGQVSRQLIFQSLAESHKVPLIEHYGRVSLGFFQAGIEWILTSIKFISAFISAFNLMAINPSLIMAAQFGTSKPSLSSSYPLWPNRKPSVTTQCRLIGLLLFHLL